MILTGSWTEALDRVRRHLERHGRINAAEARQLVDANRRVLLSLLDWLDSRGETIRRGDEHHAVRLAPALSVPES